MGNARGNRYSRNHTYLQPNSTTADGNFWDFSWHEIGYYDLPAMIDYILKETGFTKLGYIGHSQVGKCFSTPSLIEISGNLSSGLYKFLCNDILANQL